MKQKKNPQELKQVVRFYIYSIKEREFYKIKQDIYRKN